MAFPASQSRVPIAQLDPSLEHADHACVHGIVTLIWPYKSATRSITLLLVEPDFRLRRHRGQVRIEFRGSSATAIRKAGIGSGDHVTLSLQDASWEKDVETAQTPGKGIEWKVTFGERAVLEIQHPSQTPILLNIDHPPPSPQGLQQISSPPNSPLYNSHIPTSARRLRLSTSNRDDTSWSSPAFLRRQRATTSSYDPFPELENEDLDNKRRKKTKFGRGSGQWKFVGDAPSPEREGDNPMDSEAVSTPSITPQSANRHVGENMGLLASSPLAATALIPDLNRANLDAPNSTPFGERIISISAENGNIDGEDHGAMARSPPMRGSTPDLRSRRSEVEFKDDQPRAPSDLKDLGTVTRSAQNSSRQSSHSVLSNEDLSSTSNRDDSEDGELRDNASDAFWSESVSDYGLDGTLMSKMRQAPTTSPMATEIGRKWVAMQEKANESNATGTDMQPSNLQRSATPGNGPSSNGFLVPSRQSDKSIAISSPEVKTPPKVHPTLDAKEELQEKSSSLEEDGEDGSMQHIGQENVENSLAPSATPSDLLEQDAIIRHQDITINDEIMAAEGQTIMSQTTPGRVIFWNNLSNHENMTPSKPSMNASPESQARVVTPSNDEEVSQQKSAPDELKSPPAVTVPRTEVPVEERSENEVSTEDNNISIPHDPSNQPKISQGPVLFNDLDNDMVNANETSDLIFQGSMTGAESLLPETRVPSTTRDSYEKFDAIQFVTSRDEQQMNLVSQAPALPNIATLDDRSSLSPKHAHKGTGGIEISSPMRPKHDDTQMTTPQRSEVEASEKPAQSPDIRQHHTSSSVQGLRESNAADDVAQQATSPRQGSSRALFADLDAEASPPAVGEDGNLGARRSSLITRLRELRRHTTTEMATSLSSSSASPWSAPRRPSVIPNDGADSNSIPTPSEGRKIAVAKNSIKATREKTEMRLSESFIRSYPPQSPQPKSPRLLSQASQYFPNSQGAAGFRTNLSYFVPIASLHCHYGTLVDILAVAISSTSVTRASSGPRDHTQTIYFADPSSAASKQLSSLTTAQIFRPYRARQESSRCFPEIRIGDAILLRDFKVQSFQNSMSLISTDSSAWAVFRKGAETQIAGPPVEHGPEERAFARALVDWWDSLDPAQSAALVAAIPQAKVRSEKKTPTKKGLGFDLRSSQHENDTHKIEPSGTTALDSSRKHSEGLKTSGEPENKGTAAQSRNPRRVLRPRNTRGKASASPEKDAMPKVEEIHELRDGTRYTDREGVSPEEVEMHNGVHDLRDGTRYRDRLRK